MFLSILHRMILWELIKIFALSLLALTGILLMAGIVAEASQQGLGPAKLLTIIPLLIPSTLPYTIPATTLFATCLVYGRLAADNEVLAIKSAGVNILKVVGPGVLLGLAISGVTMGLYYYVIPYTHHYMRLMLFRDLQELLYTTLKKDGGISHPRLDYSVFVRQVQGKKLIDATFKRRDRKGGYDVVIQAREAELEVDPANDCLVVHMRYGEACHEGGTYVSFLNREERVPLPEMLFSKYQPRPRDMTWKQLHEARAGLVQNIADIDHELEEAAAGRLTAHTPENLPKHVKALKARQQWHRQEMQQIDTEYQMRPALSLGCLCFVLIGCPVGIWFSRSDYLSAFITCFLPIVFVYYPLTLCTTNFAKDNLFHPALTVWSADLVVVLVSLVLYAKLLRN